MFGLYAFSVAVGGMSVWLGFRFVSIGLDGPKEPFFNREDKDKAEDLVSWFDRQGVAFKDKKLADRQAMMFFRLFSRFLGENPGVDLESIPMFTAVGPAQTNLEKMLEWGKRVQEGVELPSISPAGAISLLPNSPFTWNAVKSGLCGESSVWMGFMQAGHSALFAAAIAARESSLPVLAAAVNCPQNYFVESTLNRGLIAPEFAPKEVGALLFLYPEPPADLPRITGLDFFPKSEDIDSIVGTLCEKYIPQAKDTTVVLEGVNGRHDLSSLAGSTFCASFFVAIVLASQKAFGTLPVVLVFRNNNGSFRTAVVGDSR